MRVAFAIVAVLWFGAPAVAAPTVPFPDGEPPVATFSIVAWDRETVRDLRREADGLLDLLTLGE